MFEDKYTTGLCNQGISNAVGLAVASKYFATTYNEPNFDNKIWCFTDDGCLEALSIASTTYVIII